MTGNGETINKIMTKVPEYKNEDGANCLIVCYKMLFKYVEQGNDPDMVQTSMKKSTEVVSLQ